MDLSTIIKRLHNRHYRRVAALLCDLRYVFDRIDCNAHWTEIRAASVLKELCLEIIGRRDVVIVYTTYQRLMSEYELRRKGECQCEKKVEARPSTSRVAAGAASTSETSNSRGAIQWSFWRF